MKFSALPNEAKIEFINQVAAKSNRKLPEQIIYLNKLSKKIGG